jgi:hypothetical protein
MPKAITSLIRSTFRDATDRDLYYERYPLFKSLTPTILVGPSYQHWDGGDFVTDNTIGSTGSDTGGGTTPTSGLTYDVGNFACSYSYYPDGKIYKEIITGDINRVTTYAYVASGLQNAGRVLTEKIEEGGKTITRTFSYSSDGKVDSISTATI